MRILPPGTPIPVRRRFANYAGVWIALFLLLVAIVSGKLFAYFFL